MPSQNFPERVIIAGAAGRDFHDFNSVFRNNDAYEVVAFTATQIPNIEGRRYPAKLSGELYEEGIPIYPESQLEELIDKYKVNQVIFSYSDVSHEYVMHLASRVLAAGADFRLIGPHRMMLRSERPVVSVNAVRTGSGKSQTSRHVVRILKELGFKNVVAVRHPMPYGDLVAQAVQRFSSYEDMDKAQCTIEEREEYEPYVEMGAVIYAGVDYHAILERAEAEADVIVWDGGNNDLPFYKPDVHIVVVDPHRPGHELAYHPGETNLRRADVVVINKMDTASLENIDKVRDNVRRAAPGARIVEAASPLYAEDSEILRGKRALVIEDGPTLTHGEMRYGAGVIAARKFGATEIVDPRPWTVGSIRETYETYPFIGPLLPAMGYGDRQIRDLEATVNRTDCDVVVIATPINLQNVIRIQKPAVRVRYELQEIGRPTLEELLSRQV
jgi:predicted GTPase